MKADDATPDPAALLLQRPELGDVAPGMGGLLGLPSFRVRGEEWEGGAGLEGRGGEGSGGEGRAGGDSFGGGYNEDGNVIDLEGVLDGGEEEEEEGDEEGIDMGDLLAGLGEGDDVEEGGEKEGGDGEEGEGEEEEGEEMGEGGGRVGGTELALGEEEGEWADHQNEPLVSAQQRQDMADRRTDAPRASNPSSASVSDPSFAPESDPIQAASIAAERSLAAVAGIAAECLERELSRFEVNCPPGGEQLVVLYVTSLEAVRKTHADCVKMRALLKVRPLLKLVVLYVTSLEAVRKTHADCVKMRALLKVRRLHTGDWCMEEGESRGGEAREGLLVVYATLLEAVRKAHADCVKMRALLKRPTADPRVRLGASPSIQERDVTLPSLSGRAAAAVRSPCTPPTSPPPLPPPFPLLPSTQSEPSHAIPGA
ncbi:unnamed protein product [Closterium sp. Yama58-4]|nr:unnamed protein product [Closterium sp. Yama58-4]